MAAKKKTARGKLGAATNSGKIPAPESSDKQANAEFNAFLKADDIGKIGATAALTFTGECRIADSGFGEQLIAEVKLGREHFDWGITLNTPNHRMLYERFGDNPKRWRNKRASVVVKMSRQNRPYIAVARS